MPSDPSAPLVNPYAAPAYSAPGVSVVANNEALKLVKQFRSQMHALGGLWIVLGVLAIGIGVLALFAGGLGEEGDDAVVKLVFFGIIAGIGTAWALLGVMTCLKQMWAVYIGLVLCYLSLVSNIVTFNLSKIIALAILGAAIVQAHRVIGWSKDLRRQGIPLTTRPEAVQTPVNLAAPKF